MTIDSVATFVKLDDQVVEEARRLGGHRTKRQAVTKALEDYVRRNRQLKIAELFGTIDFDPNYNYKAERIAKQRKPAK